MSQPVLYLMVGYPGSGKTTTAQAIHEMTGAVHLWADKIRRERYGQPTYSHAENLKLYEHMDELTAELLRAGNSVIFDTNFNFKKDRDRLRRMAEGHNAQAAVVWLKTPIGISRQRATKSAERNHTRLLGDQLGNMPLSKFDHMTSNLQPPDPDEQPVKIDGTELDLAKLRQALQNRELL